jgi:phosphatidylglycerophosphate synthase
MIQWRRIDWTALARQAGSTSSRCRRAGAVSSSLLAHGTRLRVAQLRMVAAITLLLIAHPAPALAGAWLIVAAVVGSAVESLLRVTASERTKGCRQPVGSRGDTARR